MERWNDRGAAIVPYNNNIILMRRERGYGKNKQIYYTIPGGGREPGEKINETTIREIKEELGIEIKIDKLMYKIDTVRRMQYIFLGKYVSGKLGTGEGEEFQGVDYNKFGKYIPEVVSLAKLKKIKLVPVDIKREIIKEYDYIVGNTEERVNKTTRVKRVNKKKPYIGKRKYVEYGKKKENRKNIVKKESEKTKNLTKIKGLEKEEKRKNKRNNKKQNRKYNVKNNISEKQKKNYRKKNDIKNHFNEKRNDKKKNIIYKNNKNRKYNKNKKNNNKSKTK